jgi:NitT/TauT family transport system substrate-binding protein
MHVTLVENLRAVFYAPFYAALATGAYIASGVDVHFMPSPVPGEGRARFLAGEADVMWGGPLNVLLRHDANPADTSICFCNVVERDPFFVIGRTPAPAFALENLAGAHLATVSEVPTPWICLQDDLRRAGVDPASLHRRTDASMAANVAALARGEVDAIQVFQPYAEQALRAGGHLWCQAADRGLTAYTTLITDSQRMATHRAAFKAMTSALGRTLNWVATAAPAEIASAVAAYFPDLPAELLAASIARCKSAGLWATDTTLTREGFERLRACMLSAGAITHGADFEDCVDNSLSEKTISPPAAAPDWPPGYADSR